MTINASTNPLFHCKEKALGITEHPEALIPSDAGGDNTLNKWQGLNTKLLKNSERDNSETDIKI